MELDEEDDEEEEAEESPTIWSASEFLACVLHKASRPNAAPAWPPSRRFGLDAVRACSLSRWSGADGAPVCSLSPCSGNVGAPTDCGRRPPGTQKGPRVRNRSRPRRAPNPFTQAGNGRSEAPRVRVNRLASTQE